MEYLLDTNALIGILFNPSFLSHQARSFIEDEGNALSVSIVSLWEIGIKQSIGKIGIEASAKDIEEACASLGISILPILSGQIDIMKELPFHHRDPFDRIIIAQAILSGVPIITSDEMFCQYEEIEVIW